MDPRRYFVALRKHWLVIIALGIVGALGAALFASVQPIEYQATSSVIVSSTRGETTQELVQGSTYTQDTVASYAALAKLPAVLDPVISSLGLDTTSGSLANNISASVPLNTVIIEVTATAGSAQGAADLANAVTASLATVVTSIAPTAVDAAPAVTLNPVASAQAPSAPYSPRWMFLILTGIGLGLLAGIVFAIGRELLDNRVRSEDIHEIQGLADVPLLGTAARRRGRRLAHVVVLSEPQSPAAEDYRRLATNLEFAGVDQRLRAVTVTSALPGDGKTTTALNLAAAVAERGSRVLVVDADLRRPAVSDYLNIEGAVGLTNVLLGGVSAEDAIQRIGAFDVLPAGTTPPNVTQLVTSDAMARLFGELTERYDFVVVDSPPVLAVTDGLSISALTDGALVVARQAVTRRRQLAEAVESLNFVNSRVLGVVLNGVAQTKSATYGYDIVQRTEVALPTTAQPPVRFFRDEPSDSSGADYARLASK
ncbi:polysaccharide biosynthesis tyrosine autokinase [Naasia lichenicola]|uniref:polysaccharide biosynthesis tyrosine autokinase n=1 Tax=Naasia lichenicola TaxID=2565933 RepID=UPI00130E3636|nr:polysaccharide biosynthesis tyrosine autokinase [Naasia lichenicola]